MHSTFAEPFLHGIFPFELSRKDIIHIASSFNQESNAVKIADLFLRKANIPGDNDNLEELVKWIVTAVAHGESAQNTTKWLFQHAGNSVLTTMISMKFVP